VQQWAALRKKKAIYLAWYHPATSQCRLT